MTRLYIDKYGFKKLKKWCYLRFEMTEEDWIVSAYIGFGLLIFITLWTDDDTILTILTLYNLELACNSILSKVIKGGF